MAITPEEKFMKAAIRQAKKARDLGETPIGCVIEFEGKIIGRGYNRRMTDHTVLAHAEIIAGTAPAFQPAYQKSAQAFLHY